MRRQLAAVPADLPGNVTISRVDRSELPSDWRGYPGPDALRDLGSRWAEQLKSAVLAVPSVIIPHEPNYLLNPRHHDFKKIRVGRPQPFSFDPRLWKRG